MWLNLLVKNFEEKDEKTREFLEKLYAKLPDNFKKFGYEAVSYAHSRSKIKIFCKTCKECFEQTANCHGSGHGCKNCQTISLTYTQEEILEKFKSVHGDKYDYSKVTYKGDGEKVIIICNKCSQEFQQRARFHKIGHGCPNCVKNRKLTLEEITAQFIKMHNDKYDYSKIEYKNEKTKIIIICKKCQAEFLQTPNKHKFGQGCPNCFNSNKSKTENSWLDFMQVPIENRNKTLIVNGRRFVPDGIDKVNKKVYEFDGDIWHENPAIYNPNDINPMNGKLYGELYQATIEKKQFLTNAGWEVISIWGTEWEIKCIELGLARSHNYSASLLLTLKQSAQ